MAKKKNEVIVLVDKCKGCGLCTTACPVNIMKLDESLINAQGFHPAGVTDMDQCVGCCNCAMMCPDNVLSVIREELA